MYFNTKNYLKNNHNYTAKHERRVTNHHENKEIKKGARKEKE